MLAYGGGSAAAAYLLFQWLGKKWIENKFAQRLEQLRHQQALDLQRLRVEIDSMLSGAIKLQEKEFSILPEAWAKLDEAHSLVGWLVSPFQQYADVGRMNNAQLEEFLADTEFSESQKDDVRSAPDKNKEYQDILFWAQTAQGQKSFRRFANFRSKKWHFLVSRIGRKIHQNIRNSLVSRHLERSWA